MSNYSFKNRRTLCLSHTSSSNRLPNSSLEKNIKEGQKIRNILLRLHGEIYCMCQDKGTTVDRRNCSIKRSQGHYSCSSPQGVAKLSCPLHILLFNEISLPNGKKKRKMMVIVLFYLERRLNLSSRNLFRFFSPFFSHLKSESSGTLTDIFMQVFTVLKILHLS